MSVEAQTVQILANWVRDTQNGLAAYIQYYIDQKNTDALSKIKDIYSEIRQIFGV
ncbi:MAG: hypothetical protein RBG13Loki_3066 [Promethearchaeota archaeon CR_4]|nr:MAG: hypothetical protein RBG13Loki_3066 [Candidatus Lokiarchaeota archaeon CR_4]